VGRNNHNFALLSRGRNCRNCRNFAHIARVAALVKKNWIVPVVVVVAAAAFVSAISPTCTTTPHLENPGTRISALLIAHYKCAWK
jgi:hypothetical protein